MVLFSVGSSCDYTFTVTDLEKYLQGFRCYGLLLLLWLFFFCAVSLLLIFLFLLSIWIGSDTATLFAEKKFDNVYLLTGGTFDFLLVVRTLSSYSYSFINTNHDV
jgi:hypothetical protein